MRAKKGIISYAIKPSSKNINPLGFGASLRGKNMHGVCPSWLSFILYNPVRKAFTDRERILDESGITAGSVVLEVGPGNGFLTEAIAARAKKVQSIEIQEGMVRKLRKRTLPFGDKVEIILGDIALSQLTPEAFDVCLLYYSFHEIALKDKAAENIARAIKKGGILSIYEPSIEVNKTGMRETLDLFVHLGLEKETERAGIFTRFARMRKE